MPGDNAENADDNNNNEMMTTNCIFSEGLDMQIGH